MAKVIHVLNPFEPHKDTEVHEVEGGRFSIRTWLQHRYPGFREFRFPTICLINGQAKLRSDWDTWVIGEDDTVNFVTQAGGAALLPYLIYASIALAVGSIAMVLLMPVSKLRANLGANNPAPDPVYSYKGQTNQMKLGNPIESPYGLNRLYPSIAAPAYNEYTNGQTAGVAANQQYFYGLFCLGQGQYDVQTVQIGDTDIANYVEATYEIYAPGEPVTLFPDGVITNPDVTGIELLGPNEVGYLGYTTAYAVIPPGYVTTHIELDVVFPGGLYSISTATGAFANENVTVEFQYQPIDDSGTPLAGWSVLTTYGQTLQTNTPQRFTLSFDGLTAARYQVKAVRINNHDTTAGAQDEVVWDAMRAWIPSTTDFGDVTIMAVRILADNNLNDSSASQFNVICTRMLPIWNGTSWSAPTATRNPVWAFCDIMKSTYGGNLTDAYLNLPALLTLANFYDANGDTFDFVFDQATTVWDAAKTVALVGRAVPMLVGTQLTLIRDAPQSLPVAVFNQENIVANSWSWEITLPSISDYDGMEITYIDPSTWQQETVDCVCPDQAGNYLEQVTLYGCQDRDRAYRQGMYMRLSERYLIENITFDTGLEGHIPTYGDLIAVSYDVPRWGMGGMVKGISGSIVTLSEPVSFDGVSTYQIVFRSNTMAADGPYTVTQGADPYHVVLASPWVGTAYDFGGIKEAPLFLFGVSTLWSKLCIVTSISPKNDDTVTIQCTNYNPVIFDYETATAPLISAGTSPSPPPDLPVVLNLTVYPRAGISNQMVVVWTPSPGAQYYIVQQSFDNVNWEQLGTTKASNWVLAVTQSQPDMYLRVAGVNAGQGPWALWNDAVPSAATTQVVAASTSWVCALGGYGELGTQSTPPVYYTQFQLIGGWGETVNPSLTSGNVFQNRFTGLGTSPWAWVNGSLIAYTSGANSGYDMSYNETENGTATGTQLFEHYANDFFAMANASPGFTDLGAGSPPSGGSGTSGVFLTNDGTAGATGFNPTHTYKRGGFRFTAGDNSYLNFAILSPTQLIMSASQNGNGDCQMVSGGQLQLNLISPDTFAAALARAGSGTSFAAGATQPFAVLADAFDDVSTVSEWNTITPFTGSSKFHFNYCSAKYAVILNNLKPSFRHLMVITTRQRPAVYYKDTVSGVFASGYDTSYGAWQTGTITNIPFTPTAINQVWGGVWTDTHFDGTIHPSDVAPQTILPVIPGWQVAIESIHVLVFPN